MTREAIYKKRRYRTDPAFRAARLAECKIYYAQRKDHPIFKELVFTRSSIYHRRESLRRREAEVTRMYDELAVLIEKRDKLAAEWHKVRPRKRK